MPRAFAFACPLLIVVSAASLVASPAGQLSRPGIQPPPPAGQRIVARDGDVVIIEDDARVKIVRRREANIRIVFDNTQRWLIVLADFVAPNGTDGRVDQTYTFHTITGDWPLDARWEGMATLEEYSAPGEIGGPSLGIITAQGLVQLLNQPTPAPTTSATLFRDTNAVAVLTFRGSGRGSGPRSTFDEAEQTARRNAERSAQPPSVGFSSSVGMSVTPRSLEGGVVVTPGDAPVRVGGSIRQPVKVVDVKPVYPETAVTAGIRGVVILELTIDTDGSVKDARVLRSIPLLDEAAVAAARQWKYEPTFLNGRAVPIILTVTVPF